MSDEAQGNFSGKRLVIFGAGYVGSAIAREALARGMSVTALTRNEAKAKALRELGIATVVADLAGQTWHGQIAGEADLVLNCVSSGGGGVTGYAHSYLGGMKSMAAWTNSRGAAGTLVYTSSTSVYPQGGGIVVDETAATDGSGERSRVLVEAEETLRTAATRRWFILRLAGIYGPGRHHLLEQVRAGEVAGRGEHRLNLVHLDDICGAVWAAFGAPRSLQNQIFNVADDGAAPKSEIVSWLAAQLSLPEPRFSGEPAAGRRQVTPDRIISNAKLKHSLRWELRHRTFREGYAGLLRA